MTGALVGGAALGLLLLAAWLALGSARRWGLRRGGAPLVLRWAALLVLGLLVFLPALVREHDLVERPSLLIMLDRSLSMSLPAEAAPTGVASTPAAPTREARSLEAARALYERHKDAFRVRLEGFDAALRPLPDYPAGRLPPLAEGTDLSQPLLAALAARDAERTRAAFLVSDGRATRGPDATLLARQLPYPLHALCVGPARLDYVDLAVEDLGAPEVAFRDGELPFRVTLRGHGPADVLARQVPLVLYEGDREVRREVVAPGERTTLELVHKPQRAGFVTYSVRVGVLPGELTTANNVTATAVVVEEEPRRVVLASGSPGPELAFLRRLLAQDPRYRLEARLSSRRDDVSPLRPADLERAALVVVHRFSRSSFESAALDALASWVTGGGALLLLGNGPEQARELLQSPLAGAVPFAQVRPDQAGASRALVSLEAPYQFHPLLRVLAHPQANLQAWASLPPLLPGADLERAGLVGVVLASFATTAGRVPALLYRDLGQGVVVYLNTDELWRWKLATGVAASAVDVYGGLLRNLTGWAADRARSTGARLTVSTLRVASGDPVPVLLEDVQGTLPKDGAGLVLRRVSDDGAEGEPLPLRPVRGGYRAEFVADRPGPLRLVVGLPGGVEAETRVVVVARGEEFREPAADRASLDAVAAAAGGRSLASLEEALLVPVDDRPVVARIRSSLFWLDEWWVLAALVALLCAEWVARRAATRI